MKIIYNYFLFFLIGSCAFAQTVGDKLPPWQKGYLDIHHINTGCGECAFFILPDGTTMMIDAGENNPNNERHVLPKPNASFSPSEWIVKYVKDVTPNEKQGLDYILLTHFHSDHIGGVLKKRHQSDKYYLTGITMVAENLRIGKLIDRGYPDYSYLCNLTDRTVKNYLDFLRHTTRRFQMEQFKPGSGNQFLLLYDTISFAANFKIQNLYANGNLWNGKDSFTHHLFPDLKTIASYDMPEENTLSCALKITYGNFSYYTGGDVTGYPKPGRSAFHDVETPMARVIGEVDVCVVNHHGYNNATNDTFISTLKPRIFVVLASDALHPNHSTLYRMLTKQLYPDSRDIFVTNLHSAAKVVIGDLTDKMKSTQGHIVIRVLPGGMQYYIYILNDNNAKYKIKSVFGPYNSKRSNN
jgi:beta-lactamase superfamily II metal-dependent hydrolase